MKTRKEYGKIGSILSLLLAVVLFLSTVPIAPALASEEGAVQATEESPGAGGADADTQASGGLSGTDPGQASESGASEETGTMGSAGSPIATGSDAADAIYDAQPSTLEEVQAAVDAYEAEYQEVLAAEGVLAALEVAKPHWQYEVAAELMPDGYHCQLVDWDEDFGVEYFTFFPNPTLVNTYTIAAGTSTTAIQNIITGAAAGDIIQFDSNITLTGILTVNKSLTFKATNASNKVTITSSSGTTRGRHINVEGGNVTLKFENIILLGSGVTISTTAPQAIGGIRSSATSLTIEGAIIRNCRVNTYGAGIFSESNLTVVECEITNNENTAINNLADNNGGGGIAVYSSTKGLKLNVSDSTISNNSTAVSGGGIILHAEDMEVNITDTIISDNNAYGGGGIYAYSGGPKITINNCSITGNTSKDWSGGGVYMLSINNTLMISNSIISGNKADSGGGGIFLNNNKTNTGVPYSGVTTINTITVSNTEIENNESNNGGGILMSIGVDGAATTLTINEGSKIIGNRAIRRSGGGICMEGGTLNVENATISNNSVTLTAGETGIGYGCGGGIYLGDYTTRYQLTTLNLGSGSIIEGNNAQVFGGGIYVSGTTNYNAIANMKAGTTIVGNTAGTSGGGIYLATVGSKFNMTGGNIGETGKVNSAPNGGGAYVNNGTLTITGGVLNYNAAGTNGGGIYINNGTVSVTGGAVNYNTAGTHGGGIYLTAAARLTAGSNTGFNNNTAVSDGGAIYTITNQAATSPYSNLSIDPTVKFTANKAQAKYAPSQAIRTQTSSLIQSGDTDVVFSDGTTSIRHPLNNFDINYYRTYNVIYNPNYRSDAENKGATAPYNTGNLLSGVLHAVQDISASGIGYGCTNYAFIGWTTNADGSGTFYEVGDDILLAASTATETQTVTLYAQWDILGSISIKKYGDQDGDTALSGAVFKIERFTGSDPTSEAQLANDSNWVALYWDNIGRKWMATDTGFAFTTNGNNGLEFPNLPEATYRITETTPPASSEAKYSLLKDPITVAVPYTINSNDPNYANVINDKTPDKTLDVGGIETAYYYNLTFTVTDVAVIELPAAGSANWLPHMFVLLGAAILTIAAGCYLYYRRCRLKDTRQ